MRNQLSKILILLLLVLSPVSYSSVEIPDFSPECPVSELYQARKAVAGIDGASHAPALPPAVLRPERMFSAPRPITPTEVWANYSLSGRAPPQI